MADLSAFVPRSGEWVNELVSLRDQRKTLEAREKKLRERILSYLRSERKSTIPGTEFEAKILKTERQDFSQKALTVLFGDEWLAKAKKQLPTSKAESIRLVKIKAGAPTEEERSSTLEKMQADVKRVFG